MVLHNNNNNNKQNNDSPLSDLLFGNCQIEKEKNRTNVNWWLCKHKHKSDPSICSGILVGSIDFIRQHNWAGNRFKWIRDNILVGNTVVCPGRQGNAAQWLYIFREREKKKASLPPRLRMRYKCGRNLPGKRKPHSVDWLFSFLEWHAIPQAGCSCIIHGIQTIKLIRPSVLFCFRGSITSLSTWKVALPWFQFES